MFLRHFLHSLLVNLLLLASLKEKSTHGELSCFLGVGDGDDFEKKVLVDEAARDGFTLFWKAMVGLEVKAFPCFQE